jgi:hypothetical protein
MLTEARAALTKKAGVDPNREFPFGPGTVGMRQEQAFPNWVSLIDIQGAQDSVLTSRSVGTFPASERHNHPELRRYSAPSRLHTGVEYVLEL